MAGIRALTAIAASLVIVTAACTEAPGPAQPATSAAPAAKSVALVRIATQQQESSWNPWTYISGYPGWSFLLLQFDTLMNLDLNSEPQPWLAKEVSASADSKTWTLTLASGVKWHDGKPFTADDVKYTIEMFQKNVHGRFSTPLRDVERIEVQASDRLVITLKLSKPGWRTSALSDVPIMPKHIWEAQLATNPDPKKFVDLKGNIGTGPYQLVEYRPDQFYRFKANAEYFKGKPLVDEIAVPIVTDANGTFAALRVGDLDTTVRSLSPELVKDFESVSGMKVARGPDYTSNALWVNTERVTLNPKQVRQAISLAIDRKRLVDQIHLGFATVGSPGFIHPENAFANRELKAEFNVAKANQLLDSIGATRGADGIRSYRGQRMAYELLVLSAHGPLRLRQAELVGQMLREIGMTTTIKVMEFGAFNAVAWRDNDVRKGRDYDMAMNGWTAPVQFEAGRLAEQVHSDGLIGNLNVYGFRSTEADRLAEQLLNESDQNRRKQIAQQMQALIADELPIITTIFPDGLFAYRDSVYSGWRFQKGLGIFQKNSFLPR
jgi:peptide/nickel transport system substrate-binding protein